VRRSRNRLDGGRLAAGAARVRRVLLTNTNAPRPEQGCTCFPSSRAADGWPCDRHSAGRRSAPRLRACRVVLVPSLSPLAVVCRADVRTAPRLSRSWSRQTVGDPRLSDAEASSTRSQAFRDSDGLIEGPQPPESRHQATSSRPSLPNAAECTTGPARRPVAEAAHSSHPRDTESAYPEIVAPALQWSCAYSRHIAGPERGAVRPRAAQDPTYGTVSRSWASTPAHRAHCRASCGCIDRRQAKNLGSVARRAHAICRVAYGSGPVSQDAPFDSRNTFLDAVLGVRTTRWRCPRR
jgi:hypothetical protein